MNATSPTCPDCGTPLPSDSPQALCPACLMRQALASRTIVDGAAPSSPPPSPEEIADKFPQFEITACLGAGGMGVVYKARQKSLDRWVAIKILRQERVGEEKFAERFTREAQTLARLNHPNIVTVFDFGETGGLFYLVMEFVDGVNLRDLLRDGKLEPKQALAIVPPICEALQFAHDKGIVHRDIKPENLLLDRDGRIKIADFGIASLMGADGDAAGTPPYMAPEQSGASSEVDSRADIYALGAVLYEMLTGERPTKDLVAPSKKVHIDVRLDEMVLRALEKSPELRYQTADEFRTAVDQFRTEHPLPPASAPVKKSPFGQSPVFLTFAMVGLLVLTATGNANAMMIGSAFMLLIGLSSFAKGSFRIAMLVGLAAAGVAGVAALLFSHLDPAKETAAPAEEKRTESAVPNRSDHIAIEDLALRMIVAIREKDDATLKSLASDRVKGWRDALPLFAVELREHFRQFTGTESFDLRAGESLVEGDLGMVRCTGPAALQGKCLVLFFVKTGDGWLNHSLRNSTEATPLAKHMADFRKEIEKEKSAPIPNAN